MVNICERAQENGSTLFSYVAQKIESRLTLNGINFDIPESCEHLRVTRKLPFDGSAQTSQRSPRTTTLGWRLDRPASTEQCYASGQRSRTPQGSEFAGAKLPTVSARTNHFPDQTLLARTYSLFLQDYVHREISQELGLSMNKVQRYLQLRSQVPREQLEPIAQVALRLKLEGLDNDLQNAMPKALEGNIDYAQAALDAIKARCYLLGLYQTPPRKKSLRSKAKAKH